MTNLNKHPKTGVYRFRKAVPKELRPFLPAPFTGNAELIKSLGTKNADAAKRIHIEVSREMERILDHARARFAAVGKGNHSVPTNPAYESALAAIAGEDDFSLPRDYYNDLPPGLRSFWPVGGPSDTAEASAAPAASSGGESIASVFAAYEAEVKPTAKTASEFRRSWGLFCDVVGLTMTAPMTAPTKAQVRAFKQAMMSYPSVALTTEQRGMTALQLIEHAKVKGLKALAPKTVSKHISALSALCKFAVKNDYRLDDPTVGMNVKTGLLPVRWTPS